MNKNIIPFALIISSFTLAQNTPPSIRHNNTTYETLLNNSKKSTLIEKQIIQISKFKNLNFQVITTTDLTTSTSEKYLGISTEFETYDTISKKTLTVDKTELSKLIDALQVLSQKENEKTNGIERKYKFETRSNLEFGAVYNEKNNVWINYIDYPASFNQKFLIEFSKNELNDLVKMLKSVLEKLN